MMDVTALAVLGGGGGGGARGCSVDMEHLSA